METTYETGSRSREAGNNGSSTKAALRREAGKVSSEWTNLIADVEDLVKKVANVGDAEVARVRERVQNTLVRAKTAASEAGGSVKQYAQEATTATDEYVHESPWTAIGLAAALGVLIGFMASRR